MLLFYSGVYDWFLKIQRKTKQKVQATDHHRMTHLQICEVGQLPIFVFLSIVSSSYLKLSGVFLQFYRWVTIKTSQKLNLHNGKQVKYLAIKVCRLHLFVVICINTQTHATDTTIPSNGDIRIIGHQCRHYMPVNHACSSNKSTNQLVINYYVEQETFYF